MVINVAPQAIVCGHENPAFFPRFALKAAKPSDSRPLSRGSKFAEMQDSNSFRLRFEQELRDFCRKVTNFRRQFQILRS